jgi:hypothetical protein
MTRQIRLQPTDVVQDCTTVLKVCDWRALDCTFD